MRDRAKKCMMFAKEKRGKKSVDVIRSSGKKKKPLLHRVRKQDPVLHIRVNLFLPHLGNFLFFYCKPK